MQTAGEANWWRSEEPTCGGAKRGNCARSGKPELKRGRSEKQKICISFLRQFASHSSTSLFHARSSSRLLFALDRIPIQNGNKDATCSQNYRPIALASSLSKVLERLIGMKYETFFCSNPLQFGFKSGYSTSLCTATVKMLSLTTCIMALLC